jgi:hypothetical protein
MFFAKKPAHDYRPEQNEPAALRSTFSQKLSQKSLIITILKRAKRKKRRAEADSLRVERQ